MVVGYIYILSNAAHPDVRKIGYTANAVRDRAAELSSSGVPHPFEVEFFQLTADVQEVEELIHTELMAARPNPPDPMITTGLSCSTSESFRTAE